MEERGDAPGADAHPPDGAATGGEEGRPTANSGHRRTGPVWVWALVALIVAAIVGTAIGISLGSRQGGPLASQAATGGRPTIVVATSAAVAPSASVLPSPSPSTLIAQSPVVAQQASRQYIVQPGDTLRSIAQNEYGDASLWPRIYDANRDVIGSDPDALNAGTTLQIPPQ